MDLKRKATTFEEKLLFLYGLLGTMPILEFMGFTVFTWLTLAVSAYILFHISDNHQISRTAVYFGIVSGMAIISSLLAPLGNQPGYWKTLAIKNMVWQLLYLLIMIYYLSGTQISKCAFYIKGVYYAAVAHAVWGVLQLLAYKLTGVAINKVIFYDILGNPAASYVQTRGNSIALTGFCWNAGHIAPLVLIGFMLSPSPYLKLFFLAFSAISGSRTLIVGMIACVLLELARLILRHPNAVNRRRVLIALAAAVLVFLAGAMRPNLVRQLVARVSDLLGMFSGEFLHSQASSRVHARYWTSIGTVTRWNGLIHNLFGYGLGCSGYPFAVLFDQFSDHAWTVECDFIDNLWGTGYLGFTLWYVWYLYSIARSWKVDKRYLSLFLSLLAAGVTYNVTFNWCYLFLIMTFGCIASGINIFDFTDLKHKENSHAAL